jgi:hypothetical protein
MKACHHLLRWLRGRSKEQEEMGNQSEKIADDNKIMKK